MSFPNNTIKKFGTTKVEILKIDDLKQLNTYDENSIISILNNDKNVGKIFRLKDMSNMKVGNTILLLSKEI
ncbi:hypothetical protein [Halarcobacter sp.]|uniref:hypothetical protein n=1 Tax=Halarcobacter sp. TaxID=2321133 RepID=UPI002AA83E03|nr:hypothetical protein [Halarcobacter sp.]